MATNFVAAGSATLATRADGTMTGLTNASIVTTTARPYTTANMDVTKLNLNAVNRKLQIESTLDSVFVDIGADVVFTGKKVALPDACIMRISSEKGARTQVIPVENPLSGPGRGGSGEAQQGYERSATLEYFKVYYNEYSQAVAGEKWGVNYNDLQLFQYYAGEQPRLSKWFAEDEDKQYHEALLLSYAWPLTKDMAGAASPVATQTFNPNWFFANTEFGSQPTYSYTLQTHENNLATAANAAATGTNGINANIDLDYLIYLDYFAQNYKLITPITIAGKKTYIVLLPSNQYRKLIQINNGQLGQVWTEVTKLTDMEQNFPGVVGRVMSLLIVEDQRYPTISFNQYTAGATITPEYVFPGNDDPRNKSVYNSSSNLAWDIGSLMGAGAILDWPVTPLHFEMDTTTEYGKVYGKGAFVERGIQLGVYNTDTASNNNIRNRGSIELAFSASSIVVTA